jgi:hypothetical protein
MNQLSAATRLAARVSGSVVVIGAVLAAGTGPAYASTVVQVPVDSTGFFGGFKDVSAVSATDGWAVGGNGDGFVHRYNGTRWSLFPSPSLLPPGSTSGALLSGVDATSSTNAIAVGSAPLTGGGITGAALRWNGAAWSRLAVPATTGGSAFTAVKAFTGSDAWAVGGTTGSGNSSDSTVAMHYNGTAWAVTPTPSPGTRHNILLAVDGSGPTDVWAVGYLHNLPYGNKIRLPLILRWNGSAWSQVPGPAVTQGQSTYLFDVAAISATNVWVVGYNPGTGAFVARWNGTGWSAVPAPPLTSLSSVSARSATDVWVAGSDAAGAPALARWNGAGWTVTPVTVTGGVGAPALTQITVADPTTEWAVGYQADGTTGQSSSIAFRVVG